LELILGKKHAFVNLCKAEGFLGVDFSFPQDLSADKSQTCQEFNKKYVKKYRKLVPGKSKLAAGLACGALWTTCRKMQEGDLVVCPDGEEGFITGTISGNYYYAENKDLPHRRSVVWSQGGGFLKENMSPALRSFMKASNTVIDVTPHIEEIELLIAGRQSNPSSEISTEAKEKAAFQMEKHLEDFLVHNWAQTPLGEEYMIYENDGEQAGQQYPTSTGPIDILAISKDKKTLLVVELKKGLASDKVVGQVLRYMGCVKHDLAEEDQKVKGVIIASDDDINIRRALYATQNVDFFRYRVQFNLVGTDAVHEEQAS
jgi:restriction system protein